MAGKTDSKKWVKRFWLFYVCCWIFVVLLFTFISFGWLGFMPSFEELENPRSNLASEVIGCDGVVLGKYYIENRTNIPYSKMSPNIINALIATEDVRFFDHSGVDLRAVFRATFGVFTGGNKGGASTITQQLAKNLFPRDTKSSFFKTVFIKLKEWITASKLESNYTKEEILAMYLNTVDFGSNSFGIKSAAKTFFNTTPDSLSIEQSATLVGLLKAPTYYSPISNPKNAMTRRSVVMNQMVKYKYITEETYQKLNKITIDMSDYQLQDHRSGLATYFREVLRLEMIEWCKNHKKPDGSNYNLYKDGLKIHTTIDSKLQRYAEEAVKEHLSNELQPEFFRHWKGVKNAPFSNLAKTDIDDLMMRCVKSSGRYSELKKENLSEEDILRNFHTPQRLRVFTWKGDKDTLMTPWDSIIYYKMFLQAGLMSIEPQTGFIKAWVGGINYNHFQYDHVKLSKRQVGSTFKPFLYTLAMQEGEFSPCSKVPNVPVSFFMGDDQPEYVPKNSNDAHEGEMVTLKWALANSVNYVSAYLIKRYSPYAVIKLCRKMGVVSNIDPVPSICLGTPDISLYEMVGANATFVNKGIYSEPVYITKIEDKNGNIIQKYSPKQSEAMNEETAYLMLKLMQGVVESGTGARLRYKYNFTNPIAGKTGTTQNNSDGWFMGLTPGLVTGVWVGCEDRSVHFRATNLGQGANMALPIWAIYMKKAMADRKINLPFGDFEKPKKPLSVEIDCDKYDAEHKGTNVNFDKLF